MPINLDLDTNTAIEKFNEWEQLPEGSVQERSYFCQRVKPYLPTLRRILIEHRDTLAQLRHGLQSARAEAAEYKTRAESEVKAADVLREDLNCRRTELNAELNIWKQKQADAVITANAQTETICELRADLAKQNQRVDIIKSKVLQGVQLLNSAANA